MNADSPSEAPRRKRDRTLEFDFVLEAPRETTLRPSRPAAKNAATSASVSAEPVPSKPTAQAPAQKATATVAPEKKPMQSAPQTRRQETTSRPPLSQTRQQERAMPTTAPIRRTTTTTPSTRTGGSSAGTTRNPSVDDFRRNAERQSREQKAVGSVLSWVGYSLLGGLILVAGLAGFGGYTLMKMIEKQSVTVAQLDALYSAEFSNMRDDIILQSNTFEAQLATLREELANTQRLAAKQQETIKTLTASTEKASQDSAEALASLKEQLETEAGRRWKGDKDLRSSTYSLDKRLDVIESRLRKR